MNDTTNFTPSLTSKVTDRPGDGYDELLVYIRNSFEIFAQDPNEPLFTTDVTDLYEEFLNHLPDDARQHYNCRACRNFVNRYGGLVKIDSHGMLSPVMWKLLTDVPEFFRPAIFAMRDVVVHAKVTGIFVTDEKRLGVPKTGEWSHMAVDVPASRRLLKRYQDPNKIAAEHNENARMLKSAILKYKVSTIESAVNMLRSGSLFRSEKVLPNAEWLLEVAKSPAHKQDSKYVSTKFSNIIHLKAATAPSGFCHISSGMLGTLIDDIGEGYDFDFIKNRFNEKMDPLRYQRPQAAPSAGNVLRAEKIFEELGLKDSLKRRFARIDEIQTIWKPQNRTPNEVSSGIFANVKTKQSLEKPTITPRMPYITMTWEKFNRTVLPTAKKIEYLVPMSNNSYGAMVTAEDPDAKPIILWDKEEARNPFSWYMYARGSYASSWNLKEGTHVNVAGIALQPNLWQPGYEHLGKGVFLILEGCRDTKNGSLGLFPEILRGELREVRSTIEAFSRSGKIDGTEEASACGLIIQESTRTWGSIRLRVTTDVGISMYTLDRWD